MRVSKDDDYMNQPPTLEEQMAAQARLRQVAGAPDPMQSTDRQADMNTVLGCFGITFAVLFGILILIGSIGGWIAWMQWLFG